MFRTAILSRDVILPVSLVEAKRNLDITHADDDDLITDLIAQAVETVESRSNLLLYPASVKVITDDFGGPFSLPVSPVSAITSATRAGAVLDGVQLLSGRPYTVLWPSALLGLFPGSSGDLAELTLDAGYAAGTLPKGLVGAIHHTISILYEKPIGYDLDRAWDALDRMLQTYRLPS